MTCLGALIGDTVIHKTGQTLSTSSLYNDGTENPVLGLYFSAHWCPPCREFTPLLVQFYERFKTTANGQRFEIVFVSSDYDESAFNQYIDEMPWHSIPFHDKERKVKIRQNWQASIIASFLFSFSNRNSVLEALPFAFRSSVLNLNKM